MTDTTTPAPHPTGGPVHTHFGLTYANYLVVPRTLMQSMPIEWQERMVTCLRELNDAFENVPQAEAYIVQAAIEKDAYDLDVYEREAARVSADSDEDDTTYTHTSLIGETTTLNPDDTVLVPAVDPVPHYNRGRTYIAPASACNAFMDGAGQCARPANHREAYHRNSAHTQYWLDEEAGQ